MNEGEIAIEDGLEAAAGDLGEATACIGKPFVEPTRASFGM
jgi:hypothetical protein